MGKGNELPLTVRFWPKVDMSGGVDACWPWTAARGKRMGHGIFGHDLSRGRLHTSAHRVAWEQTYGPIPDGLFVLHACDNPPCCNPTHLFLGTPKANSEDMVAKGRNRPGYGENQWAAKLTEAKVRELRELRAAGVSASALAIRYGIDKRTIWDIVTRKTWKHVA